MKEMFPLSILVENVAAGVDEDEDEEDERPQAEERPQNPVKVGAKKQRKLEEKQARKAQREVRGLTFPYSWFVLTKAKMNLLARLVDCMFLW